MHHHAGPRVCALVLTLLVLLAAAGSAPLFAQSPAFALPDSPATVEPQAGESWWEGEVWYTAVINYLGYAEYGYGTWVGYWQNVEQGHPQVNELYLVKVSLYGVGSPASGQMAAVMNFALPPSTVIDTGSYPVRCFGGPAMAEITSGCPQVLPYSAGTYNIPSGQYGNVWPMTSGAGWEFWIPVRTSTPLSGSNLTGYIDNIEAMNEPDWLYPTVPIYVFAGGTTPAPAAFSKTSPANGATGLSTSLTLSWGTSTNATSYEVCYDTSNDGACTSWVSTGTATSKALSGLAAGTTYYWQVRAVNGSGTTYANGASTAFWSFTTAVPPAVPAAFGKAAPANGASSVPTSTVLTWGSSTGATRYEYCYDTSNDNACSSSWVSTGTTNSASLSGLASATVYYWQVRAVNTVGTTYADSASTAFWSFTTAAPVAPPGAFGRLFPANGAVDQSTSLSLHWGASSGATSYEYCYDTTNDSACSSWVSTGTATSASLSGLTPGATYYWHVRAVNGAGTTYADGYSAIYWPFTTGIITSANDIVVTMAVQPDGKILLGGYFTQVNGTTRNRIARLNADGSLDTAFNPGITGGYRVDSIVVQPDGRILVSGDFTHVGGVARSAIARLNANGTLDTGFNPGANGAVYAMALQPDGKILAGGTFTAIGGGTRNRMARLNANGSLDTSFTVDADGSVSAIGLVPDGSILIGGDFKYLNGLGEHGHLARLHGNGALDESFAPDLDASVATLVRQPDGKILIGGSFTRINGVTQNHISRLNADGSLDDKGFEASANDSIMSLAVQSDGRILMGGYFTSVNGETHNRIARLGEKGEIDTSFALDANGLVNVVALQADGKILAGGAFTQFNGQAHSRIVRLPNNTTATQTLWAGPAGPVGDVITWMPRLAMPEFQRATFELSTNGTSYTLLGEAFYSGGNWQKAYLSLPRGQDIWIRARGYYDTGRFNGSGSILEKIITLRIPEIHRVFLPLVMR
jgi:uncharacterized delta-60 repeat protein